MANITNNNFNKFDLRVSESEYWDFVLSKQKDPSVILDGSNFYDGRIISYIDINNNACISGDTIRSVNEYKWSGAENIGLQLDNIGFTGIDTGLINFDKNTITSDEFNALVTGSSISISSGDTRLILHAVSGNTGDYTYSILKTGDTVNDFPINYVRLDGGFYQGFFKSYDYEILPSSIEQEISFDFILKPDFITIDQPNTLNYKHNNNKGFFFYLGIKSENKFWYEYSNNDASKYEISKTGQTSPLSLPTGTTLCTNDGFSIDSQNIYDIKTDNKYLLFNRTKTGQVASYFDETKEYHITGQTKENINYYPLLNRTKTGYTASNIDSIPGTIKPYTLIDDVTNNAIGFRLTNDGSVGYRIITEVCQTGLTGYTYILNDGYAVIEEEYSKENVVYDNEITFITVRMILSNISDYGYGNRTFRLWFYSNGNLVFTSKELPEMLLRKINDTDNKQEGVGYNLSFGGGSQGLSDMIGFDEKYSTNYLLPIEKYFAGTFIGNIYKFRVNYGKMDYSKIKNNYDYEFYKSFNGSYIRPSISFWLEGINISNPETNYNREIGNISTTIKANIKLNNPYCQITGYKLYYYRNDNINKELIGEFNDLAPYGGDITYNFTGSTQLAQTGLTTLKFAIEVSDTCNSGSTGTIKDETINFDNMIFYGTIIEQPIEPTFVRVDSIDKIFNINTYEITLRTGARDKIFVIAVPSDREISKIVDQSAAYVDITNAFIISTLDIEDAGGKLAPYTIYTMSNAIPYNRNHNLVVYIN